MGGGNLREKGVGTLQVAREGMEIGIAMEKKWAHYENILQYSVIFDIEKDRAPEKSAKMHRMANTTKS